MNFFNTAFTVLLPLFFALVAGLVIGGAATLFVAYGNDNPGAIAHVR